MAIGEMGEGERDGTSSIKAGMMGEVYVEFVAEVTGRNGKWLRTGNWRAIGVDGVDMVFKLSTRVSQVGSGMDTFVVVDIIEG